MNSNLTTYFERTRGHIVPGSHRLQKLLTPWLSKGILNIPSILIGGSNGKGSTCAYLESIFRANGYKTGLYTSPHLISPCERIRLHGVPVSNEVLDETLEQINSIINSFLPDATFFEISTAAALIIFLNSKIDILICEVGLGGHLDSTNAISPLCSILTSVSLEHTSYLGNTVFEIAADKSHIARRNRPFIYSNNIQINALEGIINTSEKIGCELIPSTNVTINSNLNCVFTALNELEKLKLFNFKKELTQKAIENSFWPGRFDIRKISNKNILFDAAHNPESFDYFLNQYNNSHFANQKCILVFASFNDKDWRKIFQKFHLIAEHVILTEVNSERSERIYNFQEYILELEKQNLTFPKFEVFENYEIAVKYAMQISIQIPILVTGSIAFIGDVMKFYNLKVFDR